MVSKNDIAALLNFGTLESPNSMVYTFTNHSNRTVRFTVEPVYYGHLGTNKKCPDYQGVLIFQVSLYDKAHLGVCGLSSCPYFQVP